MVNFIFVSGITGENLMISHFLEIDSSRRIQGVQANTLYPRKPIAVIIVVLLAIVFPSPVMPPLSSQPAPKYDLALHHGLSEKSKYCQH